MVLSIIFLEDKHKMLLHLSIFYEKETDIRSVTLFFIFNSLNIIKKKLVEKKILT